VGFAKSTLVLVGQLQTQLFLAEVTLPINTLWVTTVATTDFGQVTPLPRPQESEAMSLPRFYLHNLLLPLLKPLHLLISHRVKLELISIWFTEQHHLLPIHQPSLAKVQARPRL
jgi:hypothetical protein